METDGKGGSKDSMGWGLGSSAGGYLVAMIGVTGEGKTFDVGENLDQSSKVKDLVDYSAPPDFIGPRNPKSAAT